MCGVLGGPSSALIGRLVVVGGCGSPVGSAVGGSLRTSAEIDVAAACRRVFLEQLREPVRMPFGEPLHELVGQRSQTCGRFRVGREGDWPELEQLHLGDGPLRQPVRVVVGPAGFVVPLFLDDPEPERRAVGARFEAGYQVPVVGRVEQRHLGPRPLGFLPEHLRNAEDLVADVEVVAVVVENLDLLATFGDGLGERARGEPFHEVTLEPRPNLGPRVEHREPGDQRRHRVVVGSELERDGSTYQVVPGSIHVSPPCRRRWAAVPRRQACAAAPTPSRCAEAETGRSPRSLQPRTRACSPPGRTG